MAEGTEETTTAADNMVRGLCVLLGLVFALPFGEALYHRQPIGSGDIFYFIIGLAFEAFGSMWPKLRRKIPQTLRIQVLDLALDGRWWLTILLLGIVYLMFFNAAQRGLLPSTEQISAIFLSKRTTDNISDLQSRLEKATSDNGKLRAELDSTKKELAEVKSKDPFSLSKPFVFSPTVGINVPSIGTDSGVTEPPPVSTARLSYNAIPNPGLTLLGKDDKIVEIQIEPELKDVSTLALPRFNVTIRFKDNLGPFEARAV